MRSRIIETEADVAAGVHVLRRKCAIMRSVHDAAGMPPLRRHPPGFEGLARIIVGQQLSVQSAEAIWRRFAAVADPMTAASVLARTDEEMRAAGLSRAKVRTLRTAAGALMAGLDLERLEHSSDEEVHTALTAISGIGPWTADIYILFCLGRADAFPPGDLALQIAAQAALGLDARPERKALLAIAERWRPWRAVAARLLWSYYRVQRAGRLGVAD